MAITISNRLITPYSAKDSLKVIWGDTQTFEFTLPSPHQAGDSYHLGIDQDRVVYPPSRPLCAYSKAFEVEGAKLTMTLTYNTGRLRDYVCKLRKPTPIYIQLDRVRNGKCDTLLLDTLLALPSVLDSQNTVVEGDPLAELLEAKLDKPYAEGNPGEILSLDDDGQPVWRPEQEIPEQEQADWDESDSSAVTYIKNKPVISKVGHTGEYDDLLNKPDLKAVATTGSYNDLIDKPHIPVDPVQADYGQSDSSALDYIKHKPNLSVYSLVTETGNSISMSIDDEYDLVVSLLDKNGNTLSTQDIDLPIESMIVDATYANGVLTLTLQNGNTVDVDISDIVSGLVPDSRKVNGHALDEDVTISYNDLTDKPVIPEQVQSDWDESDSTAIDYIKGKPVLAAVATTGSYNSLSNRPAIPNFTGGWFGIWHDQADSTTTTVTLSVSGTNARANTFQYCTNVNTNNWTDYTLGTTLTLTQYQYVLWRNKDAAKLLGNNTGRYVFSITGGGVYLSGNIMTLKDKGGQYNDFCGAYDFYQMFSGCTAIKDASMLELPAVVGQYFSYAEMFKGCTGLVHAPRRICISNHIGNSGCQSMFEGCTSLVDAPEIECATLSANYTYAKMFYGCTSLKSAPPVLPAMVTHGYDYDAMFYGCSSLEEAPVIMATTMATGCIRDMFNGCTSLKHVKVGATALGTDNSQRWLYGVAATGVIECPSALDLSTRGADTAPAGWTIVRTDQPHSDWDESDSTEASYIRNKPEIGGDADTVQALDGLITVLEKYAGQLSNLDYFYVKCLDANGDNITIKKPSTTTFSTFQISIDKRKWYDVGSEISIYASYGDKIYVRGEAANWDIINNPIVTKSNGYFAIGGDMQSLISTTLDHEASKGGSKRLYHCFYQTKIYEVENGFKFPAGVTELGTFFYNSKLATLPAGFTIPSTVSSLSYFLGSCPNLKSLPDGFTIPSSVTNVSIMFLATQINTIGNNVSINTGVNNEGNLDKSKVTSIGTGFSYMTAYTTSAASGQAVFPNATIGSGWSIYQYTDEQ